MSTEMMAAITGVIVLVIVMVWLVKNDNPFK